ncbi:MULTISPECIES: hypothetical protein [Polymorphobacter]|uniref:phage fiber-tail adaptor protein n=1 Tax=Polymorphobacter sp. PAMC 29334 TaxID=2862331 RepID=UPI001D021601|nr:MULTISPECIES: hypothetical protein [Polymorphobacter]
MTVGIFLKDPAARLDYAVDWSINVLNGATIAASDWHVTPDEPGGVAVGSTVTAPTRTGATLDGGVPGHVYRIANRIVLTDGRADERALAVRIEVR